jgi:hypothetical protein
VIPELVAQGFEVVNADVTRPSDGRGGTFVKVDVTELADIVSVRSGTICIAGANFITVLLHSLAKPATCRRGPLCMLLRLYLAVSGFVERAGCRELHHRCGTNLQRGGGRHHPPRGHRLPDGRP